MLFGLKLAYFVNATFGACEQLTTGSYSDEPDDHLLDLSSYGSSQEGDWLKRKSVAGLVLQLQVAFGRPLSRQHLRYAALSDDFHQHFDSDLFSPWLLDFESSFADCFLLSKVDCDSEIAKLYSIAFIGRPGPVAALSKSGRCFDFLQMQLFWQQEYPELKSDHFGSQ